MKQTRHITLLISMLAVVLCSVLIPVGWSKAKASAKKEHSIKNIIDTPTVVNVQKIGTSTIPKSVPALGSLSAVQSVSISAEVDGHVDKIYFKNGQEVGNGMPIAQLNNVQAQADYQSAVTALDLARQKYNRSKTLLNTAISAQDLAQLKANVATQQAAVQSAQALLQQKQIVAPFSGVLGEFKVNVGDYVSAGTPIVNLVNTSQLRVNFNLAENVKPQLQQGQLVKVVSSAYPNTIFYGTVSFISPTIDQNTRTIAVQALVPNPKNLLSPGMFVRVSEQIAQLKNVVVVPEQAIEADLKGYYVFCVFQNNKVAQTYIDLGARDNGMVQVLSGLHADDVVVTAGQQKLQDGNIVQIQAQS